MFVEKYGDFEHEQKKQMTELLGRLKDQPDKMDLTQPIYKPILKKKYSIIMSTYSMNLLLYFVKCKKFKIFWHIITSQLSIKASSIKISGAEIIKQQISDMLKDFGKTIEDVNRLQIKVERVKILTDYLRGPDDKKKPPDYLPENQ